MIILLSILAVITALALWQLFAGLGKMRAAAANPHDPAAQSQSRIGKVQATAGGAMLLLNIMINLPVLSSLF